MMDARDEAGRQKNAHRTLRKTLHPQEKQLGRAAMEGLESRYGKGGGLQESRVVMLLLSSL